MGTKKQKQALRPLADIRESVRRRLAGVEEDASGMSDELHGIFEDLVTYHETLEGREQAMQGTLVSLVNDMSQASQTFTETGTRLDAIFDAAEGVALIITSEEKNGEIIEFSRGAECVFGYESSEIIGRNAALLYGELGEDTCCPEQYANGRQIMQRKNGETFPAIYSAYPLKDSNEISQATLIIILDNSQQEMTERLFRESDMRYQALALAAPVSIMTFDDQGVINFVNDWHLRVYNLGKLSQEDYIGSKVNELPGIVTAGVANQVLDVLEGRPVSIEGLHVPAYGDREEGWVNLRLSPFMQDGRLLGGILILEDITRRKQTELDLKMLIDSSPIPILKVELKDEGKTIRSLNPEAENLLGRDALNKPVDDYITVVEDEEIGLDTMHGEQCEVRTTNGVRQAIRTAHQPSGRFEVQAVMDVSVLIRAKEAAEDASRTKSDFIANMSHEIRTPLNVLLGMLQLFEDEDLNDEMSEMVEHATGAGQTLLTLLNDILDFTVVEARALALDEREFSLAEIVDLLAASYRVEAANKGIDFRYILDAAIPERLWGDARRLRQVIFHVMGNSVKFTDKGGVLMEIAWVPHAAHAGRGFLDFTVSDTGIGVEPGQMERIFEPFSQADGTRTRRHGGTGIGLALVYEFVSAMGGDIAVDSQPGRGTQFRFTVEVGVPEALSS
jgi:PAS domain S-box-containing protein